MSGYTILQRPFPECEHEQTDTVMEHSDLVKNDVVESVCVECGTHYHKPIIGPDEREHFDL